MDSFAQPLATLGVAVVGLMGTLILSSRQRKRIHTDPNSVKHDLELAAQLPEGELKNWTIEYASLRLRTPFESETRRRSLDDHPVAVPAAIIVYLAFGLAYAASVFEIWDNIDRLGQLVYGLTSVAYLVFPFMLRRHFRTWLTEVSATGLRQSDRQSYQAELEILREGLIAMRKADNEISGAAQSDSNQEVTTPAQPSGET